MNPSINRRSNGTTDQQNAMKLRALATYALSLRANASLTEEQRMEALKRFAK